MALNGHMPSATNWQAGRLGFQSRAVYLPPYNGSFQNYYKSMKDWNPDSTLAPNPYDGYLSPRQTPGYLDTHLPGKPGEYPPSLPHHNTKVQDIKPSV